MQSRLPRVPTLRPRLGPGHDHGTRQDSYMCRGTIIGPCHLERTTTEKRVVGPNRMWGRKRASRLVRNARLAFALARHRPRQSCRSYLRISTSCSIWWHPDSLSDFDFSRSPFKLHKRIVLSADPTAIRDESGENSTDVALSTSASHSDGIDSKVDTHLSPPSKTVMAKTLGSTGLEV